MNLTVNGQPFSTDELPCECRENVICLYCFLSEVIIKMGEEVVKLSAQNSCLNKDLKERYLLAYAKHISSPEFNEELQQKIMDKLPDALMEQLNTKKTVKILRDETGQITGAHVFELTPERLERFFGMRPGK